MPPAAPAPLLPPNAGAPPTGVPPDDVVAPLVSPPAVAASPEPPPSPASSPRVCDLPAHAAGSRTTQSPPKHQARARPRHRMRHEVIRHLALNAVSEPSRPVPCITWHRPFSTPHSTLSANRAMNV